jgi:ABC-type nitrate/sulfonate/bicarbonate transport system permease component
MYKVPEIWGAALISTGMSLALYGLVVIAEKLAMPWRRRFSAPSS